MPAGSSDLCRINTALFRPRRQSLGYRRRARQTAIVYALQTIGLYAKFGPYGFSARNLQSR